MKGAHRLAQTGSSDSEPTGKSRENVPIDNEK